MLAITGSLPSTLRTIGENTLNTLYARMTVSLEDLVTPEDCDIIAMFWQAANDNGASGEDIGILWGECWPHIKRECASMRWDIIEEKSWKRPIAIARNG